MKKEKNTNSNKKTIKLQLILLIFIVINLIVFNCIILYQMFYPKYLEKIKSEPSNLHMLIIEDKYKDKYSENSNTMYSIYHFIFDENNICKVCFLETDYTITKAPNRGFINQRRIGDKSYTELPSYRGLSIEEIKTMYGNQTILAEW